MLFLFLLNNSTYVRITFYTLLQNPSFLYVLRIIVLLNQNEIAYNLQTYNIQTQKWLRWLPHICMSLRTQRQAWGSARRSTFCRSSTSAAWPLWLDSDRHRL